MARLVTCTACGKPKAASAAACAHCGHERITHRIGKIGCALIIGLILAPFLALLIL